LVSKQQLARQWLANMKLLATQVHKAPNLEYDLVHLGGRLRGLLWEESQHSSLDVELEHFSRALRRKDFHLLPARLDDIERLVMK
jgi:hypothetical protein